MDASEREPFDRRFWWWWLASVALVYALQGVPAVLAGFPLGNPWTDPIWLVGIVVYAITLGALTLVLRRRLKHPLAAVVWASAAATLLYAVVPNVMLAVTGQISAETLVSSLPVLVLFAFLWAGNGWVAFLVPVLAAIPLRGRKQSGRYPARAGY